ncbi:MAG: hypothetical protein V4662_17865 [Verrucomicrobiota bacterium]
MKPTETTALDPVAPDFRADAIAGLARLQTLRATVKEIRSSHETNIALIEQVLANATADDVATIKKIEDALKLLAVEQSEAIFGSGSTLLQGTLALVLKTSDAVEFIGDEDDIISRLKEAAKDHPDAGVRFAARACLRIKYEVNKQFILSMWEEYSEWFESFGLTVAERVSASISERKEKAAKAPRAKKADKEPKAPPASAETPDEIVA